MNDLELTKLCAEAMGLKAHKGYYFDTDPLSAYLAVNNGQGLLWDYAPLHDDAQAMQLVKRFACAAIEAMNAVQTGNDVNRAVCEAVAHMQKAKSNPR